MQSFRQFLESDDEWSEEELLDSIRGENAGLQPPFTQPQFADPDDFYNRGGVFTFTYSNRLVKKPGSKQFEPEGLEIDSPYKAHRYLVHKNVAHNINDLILSGRYGIKDGAPVVALWGNGIKKEAKQAIVELLRRQLIHPQSFITVMGEVIGTVDNLFKPNMSPKPELEQVVQVGNKSYKLYEIPAMLHYLPKNSAEWQAVAQFICDNQEKYTWMKGFANKAGCGEKKLPAEPESIRRKRYWPTSEWITF